MGIRFEIVVGANWGDEGKGLAAAQLTQEAFEKFPEYRVLNVLYSGGAQRGHTVDYTRVFRHVYRHLGAGTLHGADTYMNAEFMVNPARLYEELMSIRSIFETFPNRLGIFIHNNCRVTTPYDIFINRKLEEKRKDKRHGSCGLGIFECRKRYESKPDMPRFRELFDILGDKVKINKVRSEWYNYLVERAAELDIKITSFDKYDLSREIDIFFDYFKYLKEYFITPVSCLADILNNEIFSTVIYEGSQGIALSESNVEAFPHLTPANTTSKNALAEIMDYLKANPNPWAQININYISRTYFTRHGTDPNFKDMTAKKLSELSIYDIKVDRTNLPNVWQGSFKYAPFDVEEFIKHLELDRKESELFENNDIMITKRIIFTHCNELTNYSDFMEALDEDNFFYYIKYHNIDVDYLFSKYVTSRCDK